MTWSQAEQILEAAKPQTWQWEIVRESTSSAGGVITLFEIVIRQNEVVQQSFDIRGEQLEPAVNAVLDYWANWRLRVVEAIDDCDRLAAHLGGAGAGGSVTQI